MGQVAVVREVVCEIRDDVADLEAQVAPVDALAPETDLEAGAGLPAVQAPVAREAAAGGIDAGPARQYIGIDRGPRLQVHDQVDAVVTDVGVGAVG
jgi:hypothetical protein